MIPPSCRSIARPESGSRRRYRRKTAPAASAGTETVRDPEAGVVRPVRGRNSPALGPVAAMVSSETDLRSLSTASPNEGEASERRLFVSRLYAGLGSENSTLLGPVVGAPYAAMLLETIAAWGAARVLYFGWCGAISDGLSIGDILVPSQAFIDEGTSLHYGHSIGEVSHPSAALGRRLHGLLEKPFEGCPQNTVWTTDGIYRETPRKIRHFRNRGAVAVEMECSALFTVGRFLGVEVAAVLVVSDELRGAEWRPGFRDERFRSARRKVQAAIREWCGLDSST